MDRPYFAQADMSNYVALIIDFINHDASISNMVTPTEKFHEVLRKFNRKEADDFDNVTLEETEM